MKGKNNEDRYIISAYYVDESQRTPSVLAVVSDGIGGHRAGEVAAEIAIKVIEQKIGESDAGQPIISLQDAIIQASETIRMQAEADPAQRGMGATCVCAWVIGDRLYTASVGDSRLYLIRDHTIRKLSIDHTWVQEAIDHGAISPDQARNHPNAHVIRRYLGSPQTVVPDLRLRLRPEDTSTQAEDNQGLPLLPGDVLLLCSDGLTDLVDDSEILEEIQTKILENALIELEDLANQRGGHDNITIIGLQMPEVGASLSSNPSRDVTEPLSITAGMSEVTQQIKRSDLIKVHKTQNRPKRLILITCMGLVSLAILAAGIFGGISLISVYPARATFTPVLVTSQPSVTAASSPHPTITLTLVSATATPSVSVAPPPQATLTPWPTNTFVPPTKTQSNPFITTIPQ